MATQVSVLPVSSGAKGEDLASGRTAEARRTLAVGLSPGVLQRDAGKAPCVLRFGRHL